MIELPDSFSFALPGWVRPFADQWDFSSSKSIEGRMRFAVAIASENILQATGGPFGAAIFNATTHALVSVGINCVFSTQCSMMHAEIVAIMLAQKKIGSFTLSSPEQPIFELVTSVAPCAMCLGAIPWSGIKRLVCGARDEDARAIGFDEGTKATDWKAALATRGIETVVDICRDEAKGVLDRYKAQNGIIYNP